MFCLSYPDIVTVTGLFLDAIGIVVLFYNAPEKFPNPQYGMAFKVTDGSVEEWQAEQARRRRRANWSLGFIVLGFFLQALAVIVW